jgi:hypothetical protein
VAGNGLGGAIFNLNGAVSVTNSTIASNIVFGGSIPGFVPSNAGGIYNLGVNANSAAQAIVTLTNTILADTASARPDLYDATPPKIGERNNNASTTATTKASHADIIKTIDSSDTNITGSPSHADPKLGALQFHGGPGMFTELPGPTSPAINHGVSAGAPSTDERGVKRPQGRAFDIGAVEYSVPVNLILPKISGTPKVGSKLTCVNATWQIREGPTGFAFRWFDNGTLIGGATQKTLIPGSTERGHQIACEVIASNAAGTKAVRSNPVKIAS